MKKIILSSVALMVFVLIVPSCKKDKKKGCMDPISIKYDSSAQEDDGSCVYGGQGGNVTIAAHPQHHGVPIYSKIGYPDSAFVKFNAVNSPGYNPASYDLQLAGDSGEEHVHIHDLKPGKYFIYMTGYDSTINQRVYGGIPYTLTQTSGEIDINVPVSE